MSGEGVLMAGPVALFLSSMSSCTPARNCLTRYGKGTIAVVSPSGEVIREVALAEGRNPSNLTFGAPDGRTVYVTVADRRNVQFFRMDRPGRSWGLMQEKTEG